MNGILRLTLICVMLVVAAGCRYASQAPSSPLSREYPRDLPGRLLLEAEGYGAIHNLDKVEELCARALEMKDDNKTLGRAAWIRACAYGHFEREYRTRGLEKKRQEALSEVARLAPELLVDNLTYLDTSLDFFVPPPSGPEEVDSRLHIELEAFGKSSDPSPLEAYRLGVAYFHAARYFAERGDDEKSKEQYLEAERFLGVAADELPDHYECQAYHLTALFGAGLRDRAEKLGKRLVEEFGGRILSPPLGDKGPFCLYAATLGMSDPDAGRQLLSDWAAAGSRDPWIHFSIAQLNAARVKTPTGKALIWTRYIETVRSGEIQTPGTTLKARASALYKLASYQLAAGQNEDALRTYEELSELTPNYAQLHLNYGVVYMRLGHETKDAAARAEWYEKARGAFRKQLEFDFHGQCREPVQAMLERLDDLEKQNKEESQ